MCIENLKCIALAVPEKIAIGVLVGVVNPNLGEEEVVEGTSRMVPFERALATSYRPPILTFPLS